MQAKIWINLNNKYATYLRSRKSQTNLKVSSLNIIKKRMIPMLPLSVSRTSHWRTTRCLCIRELAWAQTLVWIRHSIMEVEEVFSAALWSILPLIMRARLITLALELCWCLLLHQKRWRRVLKCYNRSMDASVVAVALTTLTDMLILGRATWLRIST